jgi:hypothetical protein
MTPLNSRYFTRLLIMLHLYKQTAEFPGQQEGQ